MELKIKQLEEENKLLREQLEKVQRNAEYFRKSTREFQLASESEKKLKFKMFKKFIEQTMSEPKTIYDESLKYFYHYLVVHLELRKIQQRLKDGK